MVLVAVPAVDDVDVAIGDVVDVKVFAVVVDLRQGLGQGLGNRHDQGVDQDLGHRLGQSLGLGLGFIRPLNAF